MNWTEGLVLGACTPSPAPAQAIPFRLLDPADLAEVIVRHPAAPGQVPPDMRLRVHRGTIHVDNRALGQAAEYCGRERRRRSVVGASTHEHMSPAVGRPGGKARVLGAREVQEMPAAGVAVQEHPTRRPETAARVLAKRAVEDAGVGADHPGRLRADPVAVLTVRADRPILVTECLLNRGRACRGHRDVFLMRRNPADDTHTETWQGFIRLTLDRRRGWGGMDASGRGVWAG